MRKSHLFGHCNEKILPQRKHWLGEIEPLGFNMVNNDYSSLLLWNTDFYGTFSHWNEVDSNTEIQSIFYKGQFP
jgi:hypothetical protein